MTIPPLFSTSPLAHYHNRARAGAVAYPDEFRRHFSLTATAKAHREIRGWKNYRATDLHSLPEIAATAGLASIRYKDESSRFAADGIGSFKALGGAFAVLRLLQKLLHSRIGGAVSSRDLEAGKHRALTENITVVTATDGNHGRSVAWGAARFGCTCRIYIHAAVNRHRADAMRRLGAEVIRIDGNYDDSVRRAAADAEANGWHVVSDTSYRDYAELPALVMAGYGVMLEEIFAEDAPQLSPADAPSHVFIQGGVGGLAAAVAAWLWQKFGAHRPRIIIAEPKFADCLFQSAAAGRPTEVHIARETVMAGLSCGEVSLLAWEVLARAGDDFLAIDDELVAPTMAMLAEGEAPIAAGESAVAGLAACLAVCARAELKAELGLSGASRVLVFGTEGRTGGRVTPADK